jgi:DNA-binding PadR family transcriptional regulator
MPPAARARDAASATNASLSNSAAAVLGMIALGARSGYEIRRAAELSLRFFWALGPPQIYAELRRLEKAGFVAGRDDSQGRRPRRSYEATSLGRAALTEWATSRPPAPLELRDVLLLQLFFADIADTADVTALLARIRERSLEALATFDEQIMPAAVRTHQRGFAQPKVVAEFGMALHQFIVKWCEERLGDG